MYKAIFFIYIQLAIIVMNDTRTYLHSSSSITYGKIIILLKNDLIDAL